MSATQPGEPVARGTLAETPFGHLALYLYRRNTSGTLLIEDEAGTLEAEIRFLQGRPVAARFASPALTLLDGLLPLCGLFEGEFSFFESDLLTGSSELLGGAVDPYALLTASLQQHARDDMVGAVLQRYLGKKLRLQPGRDLGRLSLTAQDAPLIELIRAAPATPEELVAQSPLPRQRTERLVYALIVTHMIMPHEQRNLETYRSQVDIRPGRQMVSVAAPAWQRLASMRPGLSGSARPGTSSSLAPRTSGRPADAPLGPRISARPLDMQITPPAMPNVAVSLVPEGEDRITGARKAGDLVQSGRCDEAMTLIEELLADEPEDSELLALRGHALFEKHRANTDGLPRAVLDSLRKALEIEPDEVRALYVRGLIYKRAGDPKKALVYFKRVLHVDPKHIEAQREIRLAKLRGT